eukprot:m.287382 g.287382  ORF g.287382 m.287382 type:complete len:167 (+) comp11767_c0_seq1:344-844(+)
MATAGRNHTSLIKHKNLSFLITDRPTDTTLPAYVETLKKNNVTALVRVCEPSYDVKTLNDAGIQVYDWPFEDGASPPADVINNWLDLTEDIFKQPNACVAVHCVAGLGRAPVMVALSLIEHNMTPEDAVIFIRDKRRGAINSKQLMFLRKYRRRSGQSKANFCACM